jgi:hypothetical protein
MEPFLLVRGKLQKDGATMNVIAFEVKPLRADGGLGNPATLHTSLPETLEYWGERTTERQADPFDYLTALRQNPPGVKNFG